MSPRSPAAYLQPGRPAAVHRWAVLPPRLRNGDLLVQFPYGGRNAVDVASAAGGLGDEALARWQERNDPTRRR